MKVTAIYELPVPMWVTKAVLGRTYRTGYGSLHFDVAMPGGESPLGEAPAALGVDHSHVPNQGPVVWTQEYGAFIPESLRPATALHRIVVTAVEGASYPDREWLTPDHQLAQIVDRWFDGVRTWVEILTGQDLDPRHRVYDAEPVGGGLTFIEPASERALGLTITTPHVRPIRPAEWERSLSLVSNGDEPPLEEVLSRDARAAQRRNANRRAVIDAATALEITLGRYVRDRATQLPESQQKRISDRAALGDYIAIAEASHLELALPFDRLRQLNRLRNDAAHRGKAPNNWEAAAAVQVMIDFLGFHGQYRRTGVEELDGGEVTLIGPEPS